MNRTLAISDIHGCNIEFNKLLEIVDYKPQTDKLILLGDFVDRGLNSKEVVEKVIQLTNEGVIALKGNHDHMFIDALNDGDDYLFLHNGGISTVESYVGLNWFEDYQGFDFARYLEAKSFIKNHFSHHVEFLQSLPHHYEDENHIYVHAGLNPFYEESQWREQPIDNFIWIRDMFLNNKTSVSKRVVFGHTPTFHMQRDSADIWFQEGKIGIDGGCCFGYQLNCLEIASGKYHTYSVESKMKKQ